MWDSVRRGEERNIFPYQESADVMFNSALIYELAVLKLYAEPQLFSISPEEPEYEEAKRLLKFLDYFLPVPGDDIPNNSLIREFIGGGCFDLLPFFVEKRIIIFKQKKDLQTACNMIKSYG